MKLFFILGNQLFPLKYLDRFKKDHVFFMAEDNGLCTYEKHHKQKILLFLSSMRSYADNLKKNKGSIVLFSTVAAQRGFTNHAIIASAKAAVEGLTVSLAAEFAPNIRVNCVAPSLTKSKIAEPMLKNTTIAEGIAKAHPLKRLGEGKDSASLAKFLITEDSSWVTGQIIAVDGGRSKLS